MLSQVDTTKLKDGRVECWSVMNGMKVSDFIGLVEAAYKNRGGLRGQREPLKTTTGRRIRSRMVEDIKKGAVLPPVVIGVVIPNDIDEIAALAPEDIIERLTEKWIDSISIIDGMQRTTALMEAVEADPRVGDQAVRVECWLARSTDSLIYRMLVLNTGQVPWSIKRQLLVVYAPLVQEMAGQVKFERLLDLDKNERRFNGGEFSTNSLVEAYLAFGIRRTEIDTQETLADEFSRLDIAEAISSKKYDHYFYPIVQILVNLDKAFSRSDGAIADGADEAVSSKFTIGRNIFDSQPARIGFVVACALTVLGRLGMDKEQSDSDQALVQLQEDAAELVLRLDSMPLDDLAEYLALDVLRERLNRQKRSAVGRHERAFFETAFKVLIETQFKAPTMGVCWRAA
ncbi:hypothetical protein [Phenylobacterium sp.]|uniref:hypothetical protein n=1 Tax=Phenylobacterium sp. TaxID=1871053 RepID=UPI0025E4643C|nr:hypothetical protein [Phenylobacterium sp.]